MTKIEIFTDGACKGNPGPGGWAYLLRYNDHEKLEAGALKDTTNNQMELMAVIEAFRTLKQPCEVNVYTDSQYVQKGIKEWVHAWQKNNWRTSQKKPVKNKELWQALIEVTHIHKVQWHWVRGHSGHPENERVDAAACAVIDTLRG